MTPLSDRIRDAIRVNGPMPVSLYMLMCLHDPAHGYYATRPGFNVDFTTAPETSQVFGELLGLWAAHEWAAMGSPSPFWLAELGPGRGMMMADMLRAGQAVPGFSDAVQVALVEASPALRQEQKKRLAGRRELFRRYRRDTTRPGDHSRQRISRLHGRAPVRTGRKRLARACDRPQRRRPPVVRHRRAGGAARHCRPVGDHVEMAPGLEAFVETIARRFRRDPGRALLSITDRMTARPAIRCAPIARANSIRSPIRAAAISRRMSISAAWRALSREGLAVHGPIQQGYFLTRLGAWERSRTLAAANPGRADEIAASVSKLMAREEMGARFKAIASPRRPPTPPGF